MLPQVLQISDHEIVVFGLSWRVLDSVEPRGEQVNKLRSQGAKFSVSYKNDEGEENFGLSNDVELGTNSKKMRLISGAAQIAKHKDCTNQEAVLVTIEEPGSEGHSTVVAVVGLLRGNVVIDEIVSPEEVEFKREWFLAQASGRDITVRGVAHTIPPVEHALTWTDVLLTKAPGVPFLPKSQYQLAVLAPQLSPRVFQAGAVIVGLMVFGGAGAQGFSYWKAADAKKKAAQARKAPDPLVVYQQSVQSLLAAPMWPAKVVLPQLLADISSQVPSYRKGGWALDAVKCEYEQAVCAYSWHREKGTMATFRDTIGTQKWETVAYGVSSISATRKVTLAGVPLPERSSWLAVDRYTINERSLWTRWQDLGAKFSYGEPAVAGLPSGLTEEQVSASPVLVRSLAWKIDGPAWTRSVVAGLPDATTLQSLSLTFKGDQGGLPSMDLLATGQIFLR